MGKVEQNAKGLLGITIELFGGWVQGISIAVGKILHVSVTNRW